MKSLKKRLRKLTFWSGDVWGPTSEPFVCNSILRGDSPILNPRGRRFHSLSTTYQWLNPRSTITSLVIRIALCSPSVPSHRQAVTNTFANVLICWLLLPHLPVVWPWVESVSPRGIRCISNGMDSYLLSFRHCIQYVEWSKSIFFISSQTCSHLDISDIFSNTGGVDKLRKKVAYGQYIMTVVRLLMLPVPGNYCKLLFHWWLVWWCGHWYQGRTACLTTNPRPGNHSNIVKFSYNIVQSLAKLSVWRSIFSLSKIQVLTPSPPPWHWCSLCWRRERRSGPWH